MRPFAGTVLALVCCLASEAAQGGRKVNATILKDWYAARVKQPAVLLLKDEAAYRKQFEQTFAWTGQFVMVAQPPVGVVP